MRDRNFVYRSTITLQWRLRQQEWKRQP